jgi:hypothetical protein
MSVGSVLIGLQASGRADGVTSDKFLAPLHIQPGEVAATRADGGPWAAGMVYFAVVRYGDLSRVDTSADPGRYDLHSPATQRVDR